MFRALVLVAAIILSGPGASAALADVNVKTPWAKVYVGPGGVFVNGPWGRVNVPVSERDRVCREWQKSTQEHYKAKGCTVEFSADGCTIQDVACEK